MSAAIALMSAIAFSSCRDDDGPQPPKTPGNDDTHRTVLVYMLAASNGLGYYGAQDLNEMLVAARAGDLGSGRLLVFHSASDGSQLLKEVTSSGIDTLKVYDSSLLSQSSARMSQVFDDMEVVAPAADYGLVLWGHGTGWLQDGTAEPKSDYQTYSYGSEYNDSWKMDITTLASTIEGRPFSFLYMDCCYMASIEVVYQMRNAVKTIAAYPTEVLAPGMPYDQNVKCFFKSTPDLVQAARNTMDFYKLHPDGSYNMCTASVVDTGGLDRLADAVRRIYDCNTTGMPEGKTPQRYGLGSFRDSFYDLKSYVSALDCDPELMAEFEDALASVVLYEDATESVWKPMDRIVIDEHSGLSTFIMKSDLDATKKNYDQLDWYRDVASVLIK